MKGWFQQHASSLADQMKGVLHSKVLTGNSGAHYKPLALTHVQYRDGDSLGYMSALLVLTPFIMTVVLATIVVTRREFHCTLLLIGSVLNALLNAVLQQMIKQPKPPVRPGEVSHQYGMPSEGVQYMWFVAAYLAALAKPRLVHKLEPIHERRMAAYFLGAFVCLCIGVGMARLYLLYDTMLQSLAGAFIGALCGCAWFDLSRTAITRMFPGIAQVGYYCCLREKRGHSTSSKSSRLRGKFQTAGPNLFVTARPKTPRPVVKTKESSEKNNVQGSSKDSSSSEEKESTRTAKLSSSTTKLPSRAPPKANAVEQAKIVPKAVNSATNAKPKPGAVVPNSFNAFLNFARGKPADTAKEPMKQAPAKQTVVPATKQAAKTAAAPTGQKRGRAVNE